MHAAPSPQHRVRQAVLLLTVVLVVGCASRGGEFDYQPPPRATGPAGAPQATPAPVTPGTPAASVEPLPAAKNNKAALALLAPERKYLADRFSGTPVVVDFDDEAALVIDVPLAYAFDAGKDQPKPALQKVLDYVSTSLRRVPSTRFNTYAPGDTRTVAGLADRRAKAVSNYVVSRGVNGLRVAGAQAAADGGSVRVRIVAGPAP